MRLFQVQLTCDAWVAVSLADEQKLLIHPFSGGATGV